jgi:hypothetical protein
MNALTLSLWNTDSAILTIKSKKSSKCNCE